MLLSTERFGIPAKMKRLINQEEVDKKLKRLKDAEQPKPPLTEEQLATLESNKKKGEEMERKWEAGDTKHIH